MHIFLCNEASLSSFNSFISATKKGIFIANLIGEQWAKEYNCSEHQNVATSSENTEVEVLKHMEVSPAKTKNLSRLQKYRQLMLLCKELSDISSDLPI